MEASKIPIPLSRYESTWIPSEHQMLTRKKSKVIRLTKAALLMRAFLCLSAVAFAALLLLRFVNPPVTAIQIWRSLQDKSVHSRPVQQSWIPINQISEHLQRAVITAEDARFTVHHGIDLQSLSSAITRERRSRLRGASTISMQVVKNLFLWPGRSYLRKGIEIIVAPAIDLLWGKRRVLEIYLNIAEWGPGIFGVEAASWRYFRHGSGTISRQEAAALAAVLPQPLLVSPLALNAAAKRRMKRILVEAEGARVPF